MNKKLVYDVPTRLFHWIFAALFLTSFVIAKTIEDDTSLFTYHMISGLVLAFWVLLRIIWGFVGTKHARFSGFSLNPLDAISYFKGILTGDKRRWAGHNPASSWAGLIMMGLALGLAITGYLMTSGPNKEDFEDIHELFANGFIVVVVLHVAGIVLHTLRHREMIGLSMIDGKKADVSVGDEISSSQTGVGVLFLGLLIVFSVQLFANYDTTNRSLNFFGTNLQLGESENESGASSQGMQNEELGEQEED